MITITIDGKTYKERGHDGDYSFIKQINKWIDKGFLELLSEKSDLMEDDTLEAIEDWQEYQKSIRDQSIITRLREELEKNAIEYGNCEMWVERQECHRILGILTSLEEETEYKSINDFCVLNGVSEEHRAVLNTILAIEVTKSRRAVEKIKEWLEEQLEVRKSPAPSPQDVAFGNFIRNLLNFIDKEEKETEIDTLYNIRFPSGVGNVKYSGGTGAGRAGDSGARKIGWSQGSTTTKVEGSAGSRGEVIVPEFDYDKISSEALNKEQDINSAHLFVTDAIGKQVEIITQWIHSQSDKQ